MTMFAMLKKALEDSKISIWGLESQQLDWVVEVQVAKGTEPLKLIVNPRLNFEVYRTEVEDALRLASFTYKLDASARTYFIVH